MSDRPRDSRGAAVKATVTEGPSPGSSYGTVKRKLPKRLSKRPSEGPSEAEAATGSALPETKRAGFVRVGQPVYPRVWPWAEPEPDPSKTGLVV
jgi:hypothetical protein